MSKRVSIAETTTSQPSDSIPTGSILRSSNSGSKAASVENVHGEERAREPKAANEPNPSSESALVRAQPAEPVNPFPDDGCERYKEDCCCCHCVAVRCALKRAAFLRTPEGQRRLELKLHMKNFLMDINAMAHVRKIIEARLHDYEEPFPSPHASFPMSITKVSRIDRHCLSIEWFNHEDSDNSIDYYEIYVDKRRHKRIFNPKLTRSVLLDVDARRQHNILMRAVAKMGRGVCISPADLIIKEYCNGNMDQVFNGDPLCSCGKQNRSRRMSLVEFWKPSEFLYMPVCKCTGNCDCDCFAKDGAT
ncbi:hypothetical protein KR222_002540 [Zaprionus bogoriensis]|nr:hypothetical protein KR222_002540 [Zaprionus bogoriensis]